MYGVVLFFSPSFDVTASRGFFCSSLGRNGVLLTLSSLWAAGTRIEEAITHLQHHESSGTVKPMRKGERDQKKGKHCWLPPGFSVKQHDVGAA